MGVTVTSIKISTTTRDRVKRLGASAHQTAEEVINAALDELERRQERDHMREEALAISRDPDDLAEAQRVLADMESARAW
jgi:predicted transcriptional regulator